MLWIENGFLVLVALVPVLIIFLLFLLFDIRRILVAKTDILTQAVADVQTAANTAVTLLAALKAVEESPATQAAIDSASTALQSTTASLNAAVAANQP